MRNGCLELDGTHVNKGSGEGRCRFGYLPDNNMWVGGGEGGGVNIVQNTQMA